MRRFALIRPVERYRANEREILAANQIEPVYVRCVDPFSVAQSDVAGLDGAIVEHPAAALRLSAAGEPVCVMRYEIPSFTAPVTAVNLEIFWPKDL
jgi:hypothetical protein